MLRYAITNLGALKPATSLDPSQDRRMRLREDLQRWAGEGLDFVQLREKELDTGEIFALAQQGMRILGASGAKRPKLLVNGRADLAAAARADGVHLTGHPAELIPAQVREVFRAAGLPACLVSVSCHTLEEVVAARGHGADLVLFGPVFEKRLTETTAIGGKGLALLSQSCFQARSTPVLALGGVTDENAPDCVTAGAAGIAGVRLFSKEIPPRVRK